MDMHPKQVEAVALKAAVNAAREERRGVVDAITAELGLRFVHIEAEASPSGHALTLAYGIDRRDVLMVATALQHPIDTYSKEMGRYVAAENARAGRFVMLRKPAGLPAAAFLKMTFGAIGY